MPVVIHIDLVLGRPIQAWELRVVVGRVLVLKRGVPWLGLVTDKVRAGASSRPRSNPILLVPPPADEERGARPRPVQFTGPVWDETQRIWAYDVDPESLARTFPGRH